MTLYFLFFCLLSTVGQALEWMECLDNDELVKLSVGKSVGVRSPNWPASLANYKPGSDESSTLACQISFQRENPKKQKIAIVFLNAHVAGRLPYSFKTNADTNVPDGPYFSYVCYERSDIGCTIRMEDLHEGYEDKFFWKGFEAIVTSYENEDKCPFENVGNTVVINNDSPRYIASSWTLSRKIWLMGVKVPKRQCEWKFAPETGSTLKIVFTKFSFSHHYKQEELILLDGSKEVFRANGTHPPSASVYYTSNSFTIRYNRAKRDAFKSIFIAVLSSFPTNPTQIAAPGCSVTNAVVTYKKNSNYVISNSYDALIGGGYIHPYASKQECEWKINSVQGVELHLSASVFDIDQYGDTLKATISDKTTKLTNEQPLQVLVTKETEVATFHWKSDGNYGRAGFVIRPQLVECKCGGPSVIRIDDSNKSAFFAPQPNFHQISSYCANMECLWQIHSPPGTILIIQMNGTMRSSPRRNDTLAVFDQYSQSTKTLASGTTSTNLEYVISNNITVRFSGSDAHPANIDEDVGLRFTISFFKLSALNRLPDQVLTKENAYKLLSLDTLPDWSSQTFTFNNEEWTGLAAFSANQLDDMKETNIDDVCIFDGDTNSYAAIYNLRKNDGHSRRNPLLSATGKITVARFKKQEGIPSKLFIRGYSEAEECTPGGDFFLVGYPNFLRQAVTANSGKLTYCPIRLVAPLHDSNFYAISLLSYSLTGSEKPVNVLPGTELSQTPPLYSFDQHSVENWNDTAIYGYVFTVMVPVGGKYEFSAESYTMADTSLYVGRTRIITSPAYPFGGNFSVPCTFTYTLSVDTNMDYVRVELEFVDLKLEGSSEVQIFTGNGTLLYTATEKVTAPISLRTGPTKTITLMHYRRDERDRGYLIKFHVLPNESNDVALSRFVIFVVFILLILLEIVLFC